MASPLIFKHRQRNPRGFVKSIGGKGSLPTNQWAYKYVLYMGRREGVVKHDELNHGLFGKVEHNNKNNFGIIHNITGTADYVKKKVEEGTYIYDNIISISKEDFERLGYDDSPKGVEAWQQLVKNNVSKMADKVGIPASRVEYVATIHIEGGKPNLHLLFWDKTQGIRQFYNYKKVASEIRANLIKYVYADDIKTFSEAKTTARNALLEGSKDWNNETFNPIYKMKKSDFTKLKDEIETNPAIMVGKVLNRNIPNSYLDETRIKIIQLMEKLPKTGRLSFGFLSPALKAEVQELAEEIIKDLSETNPDFKEEFNHYKKSARNLAKLYHAEQIADGSPNPKGIVAIDMAEKKAVDDLTKRLANQLLSSIKKIDHNQYVHGKDEYSKQQNKIIQRNTTMNLLTELFRTSREENRRKPIKLPTGSTDRIEARRDKRKELETSSGNNWGEDWDR